MNLLYTPYIIPMSAAIVICGLVIAYAIRHRKTTGSPAFILLMSAITEWLGAYLIWMITDNPELKVLLGKIEYIGVVTVSPAWALFAFQYAGVKKWLSKGRIGLIFSLPLITLLLTWTNDYHWLIWKGYDFQWVRGLLLPDIHYGIWFWVHTLYSYLLLLAGTFVIVRAICRSSRIYHPQALILIAGLALPWIGNIIYVFRLGGLPGLDLTPFCFALSGALLGFGLFYFRLLDIVPIARRAVFESMDDGLLVLDGNNRVVDVNPAFLKISGLSDSRVIGKSIDSMKSAAGIIRELDNRELEKGREILVRSDDKKRYYDLRSQALYNKNGTFMGRLIMLHNITEIRRAELEQERIHKLESIELMAGGVAHDFNNHLSLIKGNLKLVQLAREKGKDFQSYLQNIQDSAQKAEALTQQLLTFSRGIEPVMTAVDIARLIENTTQLLLSTSNINYHLDLQEDLWSIAADEDLIGQVISNLIINADQAMPEGGSIRISAFNVLDPGQLPPPLDSANRCICFDVRDQGIGIAQNQLTKIFDPYYTTKQKGSGLGLAVSFSIVRKHGGTIMAESELGVGSRFAVFLPVKASAERKAGTETVSIKGDR